MLGKKALTSTALLAIVFLSSGYSLFAQNPSLNSAATGSPAVRDPSALAVIERAISAAGGSALVKSIADFDAKGTITYHWADQDVPGQVEIKARGLDQVRMDLQVQNQKRSTLINHGRGKQTDHAGTHDIEPQNVKQMGLLTFELPALVEATENQQVGIQLIGQEPFEGATAYHLAIMQPLPPHQQNDDRLQRLRTTDVFIDAASQMVIGIRHLYNIGDRRGSIVPREVVFSDFRTNSSVVLPFSITEKQSGQEIYAIQLNQIHFNVGVLATDFQ